MKPESEVGKEALLPAVAAFIRAHAWLTLALSVLVIIPCLWHARIEAGDFGSHMYNAWLVQLVEQGQAPPELHVNTQFTNILTDISLLWTAKLVGFPACEKIVLPIFALVFFWGMFALAAAASRRAPFYLTPVMLAMTYGWTFHSGFINFYISAGLSFLALAAFWRGNRKERIWTLVCSLLICVAHPVGFVFFIGSAAYIVLKDYLPGWKHLVLLPLAALAVWGVRLYLVHRYKTIFPRDPVYRFNGTDQLWVFGDQYNTLAWVLFFGSLAFVFWDWFWRRKAGKPFSDFVIPLELYTIAFIGLLLLPNNVRTPNSFGFIQQRFSSVAAAFGMATFACVNPKKWHLGFFGIIALVFFGFLYKDTGDLNRMDAKIQSLVAGIPFGSRVTYTLSPPRGHRVSFNVHMIDRACISHCFNYENYEAAAREFRLRVAGRNRYVVHDPTLRCFMEQGVYTVQPDELPIYQIYRPKDAPDDLRIHELKPGEQNGEIGIRPPPSPMCWSMWGPYPKPADWWEKYPNNNDPPPPAFLLSGGRGGSARSGRGRGSGANVPPPGGQKN